MKINFVNVPIALLLLFDIIDVILLQVLHYKSNHYWHVSASDLRQKTTTPTRTTIMTTRCPPEKALRPCKCHHHERITCNESFTYSIGHVFKAIGPSLRYEDRLYLEPYTIGPLYKELILSNRHMVEMDNNQFHTVRFEKITLVDMISLERIRIAAFNGTINELQSFTIKGDNRLTLRFVNELFDSLSTLVNVRDMHLELNNLRMIPSYSFRVPSEQHGRMRLERLRIISRSLVQISSYAFADLHSIRSIKIHSLTGLQRIAAHAFDIAQPSNRSVIIDLRSNQLTVNSFELDSFQHVGRPIHLQLSDNNLTTISRDVFERFLDTDLSNKMQLADNPLECDCTMFWIMKNRSIYVNQVLSALCEGFAELWKLDENAFRKCAHDPEYMPRLIFRNDAAIQLMFAPQLILLPIVLQIIL